MKPTFRNILLFLFTKYVIFFILLAFLKNRFQSLAVDNATNQYSVSENALYYILYDLLFILLLTLLFSIPIYFSFRVKSVALFSLLILGIFVLEYLIYTYLASPADALNGVYNGILSILLLLLFFYKYITFKQQSTV